MLSEKKFEISFARASRSIVHQLNLKVLLISFLSVCRESFCECCENRSRILFQIKSFDRNTKTYGKIYAGIHSDEMNNLKS